ncbi:hypothetical protein JOE25_003410 [Serratia sp. PL17]|nr:hypothetical protein [Serratia sp. PL17]
MLRLLGGHSGEESVVSGDTSVVTLAHKDIAIA